MFKIYTNKYSYIQICKKKERERWISEKVDDKGSSSFKNERFLMFSKKSLEDIRKQLYF